MSIRSKDRRARGLDVREVVVFAMLGAVMFCSKLLMEGLPNIHLLGTLTVSYTVVFRTKALIPIYIYVFLNGLYAGFHVWWIPYLYIWLLLWGAVMLLPKSMPRAWARVVYPIVSALHGLAFGTLYAPVQALLFGLDLRAMLAWVAAGLPWDIVHAIGNLILGFLILPLTDLITRFSRTRHRT